MLPHPHKLDAPAIEARGLSKAFPGGHHALREFSGTFRRGERVALVGANGAGKSTLLRLLNLSYRPTSGTLVWSGIDTSTIGSRALRQLRGRIGTVPQKYDLIPQMSVRSNVLAARAGRHGLLESFWSMLSDRDRSEVERVLDVVGIAHLIDERCDRLSGGEQQRAAIARALFQDPEVLFADEPLSAVDPAGAAKLMQLLTGICESSGCTLILTSHHLHLLGSYFPRIIGLRAGQVFFDVAAGDLTPRLLSSLYGSDVSLRRSPSLIPRMEAKRDRTLRVGVTTAGCESLAGSILPEVARAHSNLELSVRCDDDAALGEDVGAGEIDVAFVLSGNATAEIAVIPVYEERVVLVSSEPEPEQPLDVRDLANLTLLWSHRHHPIPVLVFDALEKLSVGRDAVAQSIELGSLEAVKSAVVNGLGCAFLPERLVSGEIGDGLLHELPVGRFEVSYQIFALRKLGQGDEELVDGIIELASSTKTRSRR